jgi:macrolide transport system ATP-binding/permease protein
MPLLELRDVHKTYRMGENMIYALRGVTVSVEEGDFLAIMGPSGSGKSTLMHTMGLLDIPDSGSYRIRGREVSKLSEDELAILRREAIGFIFQQFNLLPRMTAAENVALPLLYSQGELTISEAQQLLESVGLGSRISHKPNELSGGQQQRVAIARSLVNRPAIILADEPTGNLDTTSSNEIMAALKELNRSGITIVIVTHEDDISKQAKRLIKMRDGVIQSDTRLEALQKNFVSPWPKVKTQAQSRFQHLMQYFKQGVKTLASNKVRTALSMLGILIGVAAVVAMLAVGHGAQKALEEQLSSLGSNLLVLRPGAFRMGGAMGEAGAATRLTPDDAISIKDKIASVKNAAPYVNGRGQVTFSNRNWSTSVMGTASAYAQMHSLVPDVGRFFTEDENKKRSRVAVIGRTIVREVFEGRNPIGEMIKINKVAFQVIGVLPEKGANSFRDQDDMILIPLFTAMHRLMGKEYVDAIDIEVREAKDTESVQGAALDLMFSRHKVALSQQSEAFQIRNMADIQAALSNSANIMTLLLSIIATISLIVGGIGIMNIMLVSVTERTREIGLRKAVGARRTDILWQFLIEAVVITLFGGSFGIVLAWIVTFTLTALAGWATSITLSSILLALFFSAGTGIAFGLYPAQKASRLSPIDALRYE